MPITQERMLTCINAGLSAFNALELAKHILSEQITNTKDLALRGIPQMEIIPILETLQILLMPETLVNTAGPMSYIEAWHQLQMEARHFREFKSTNIRAKRYQQRKRGNKQTNINKDQIELPFYQQIQEQTKQQINAKLNKTKNPQYAQTDYRNYKPEDFE